MDSQELQRAHLMLRQAYDEIRKNYYDAKFHGVDLDTTFQQFDARLNAAKSVNETFRVIAAFMLNLHDSHTFFMPPMRANRSTPGFFLQIVGDKCFVTRIRPGTDAQSKLHVGDQVLALNGFKITPAAFENIEYFVQVLSPAPAETLDIQTPAGERKQVSVEATLRKGKAMVDLTDDANGDFWELVRSDEEDEHLSRMRYAEIGDAFLLRMPTFEIPPTEISKIVGKAMKQKNLILDLRGDSGGYVDTLKELLGHFFDHEIKLGDRVTRKDTKPEMVKPHGPFYQGNLIVLIDRNSASASELFARAIQIEQRGKVIGDRSAGAVMEARDLNESLGTDYKVFYGLSITTANLVMKDGESLENSGVLPDEILKPTAADLAEGRDPVLSHAVELTGGKLDPVAAAKLFPYEWPSL